MKTDDHFRDIETVQVSVGERRILLDSVGADNWRSHTFTNLEAVPEILPPSFGVHDATRHEVNLHALIREVSGERSPHATFQLPYTDTSSGVGQPSSTVLRTIDIKLTYKTHN